MDPEEIVHAVDQVESVYANFIATPLAQLVTGKVPSEYRVTTMQKMAQRGINTLGALRPIIRDCEDVRIDMERFSILVTDLGQAIHFALLYSREDTSKVTEVLRTFHGEELVHPLIPPLAPDPTDLLDNRRYVRETQIGEGGTALVFQANDTMLRRPVALKRFKRVGDQGIRGDYLSELQSLSRVRHHNVVSTYDAGMDEQGSYIVMELVDGMDLERLLAKGPLDLDQFMDLAIQTLEGLAATHHAGLLHLDIKESNVMIIEQLSGRFHVKLIDYGRARLLSNPATGEPPSGGGLIGSIYSLSPEFIREEPLDERADLYSVGCVFYNVLAGKRPFDGKSPLEVMSAHLHGFAENLQKITQNIPPELCAWVMGLIETDKNRRPLSAKAALEQLLVINQSGKVSKKVQVVAR